MVESSHGVGPIPAIHAAGSALRMPGLLRRGCANDGDAGFTIRTADTAAHRLAARSLVGRRYAQRGYTFSSTLSAGDPELLTLSAVADHRLLGTLGMRFAVQGELKADAVFPAEMQALRQLEPELCEFTQLALDDQAPSRPVLAALFHTAFLHAHRIRGAQMAVIEVNPRHVPYYRRMLGFQVCGETRLNPRVQAPSVLMSLSFTHAQAQAARYGGKPALAGVARTLYPYCFAPAQELAILEGLLQDTASAIAIAA